MITQENLDHWFTFHNMTSEQIQRANTVREAAKAFAEKVLGNTPASADQTVAIRKVREATWVAIASIACQGK